MHSGRLGLPPPAAETAGFCSIRVSESLLPLVLCEGYSSKRRVQLWLHSTCDGFCCLCRIVVMTMVLFLRCRAGDVESAQQKQEPGGQAASTSFVALAVEPARGSNYALE